jgi:hypothetical protein
MATKDKKKVKKVKVIVRRKKPAASKSGSTLPKSVKALLGYLGKSDAALSGSSAPQRAQLAPQVQEQQQQQRQQQQQQQQQQFVFRPRVAQGTVIGKSPLLAIQAAAQAPPPQPAQNIIIKNVTAQKNDDNAPPIPDALQKINQKIAGIQQFGERAISQFQSSLKRMDERVKYFEEGWEDVQNLETPAIKSSIKKPNIKETRFGSAVSINDVAIGFASISPQRRLSFGGAQAAVEQEEAEDAGDFFAEQHLQNVTNPDLQPAVKVRGRKPGSKLTPTTLESYRTKRAATASAKKAQTQQLYDELEQTQSTRLLDTAAKKVIMIKPKRLVTPRKRAEINDALTASANIEQLVAGGGAAAIMTPTPPASVFRTTTSGRKQLGRKAKGGTLNTDEV